MTLADIYYADGKLCAGATVTAANVSPVQYCTAGACCYQVSESNTVLSPVSTVDLVCIPAGTKAKGVVTTAFTVGDKLGAYTASGTGIVDSAGAAIPLYAMIGCGSQGASMLAASVIATGSFTYSLL